MPVPHSHPRGSTQIFHEQSFRIDEKQGVFKFLQFLLFGALSLLPVYISSPGVSSTAVVHVAAPVLGDASLALQIQIAVVPARQLARLERSTSHRHAAKRLAELLGRDGQRDLQRSAVQKQLRSVGCGVDGEVGGVGGGGGEAAEKRGDDGGGLEFDEASAARKMGDRVFAELGVEKRTEGLETGEEIVLGGVEGDVL